MYEYNEGKPMFVTPSGKQFPVELYTMKFKDPEMEDSYLKNLCQQNIGTISVVWLFGIVFVGAVTGLWIGLNIFPFQQGQNCYIYYGLGSVLCLIMYVSIWLFKETEDFYESYEAVCCIGHFLLV